MKEKLNRRWRTYKLFCYSGKIEYHHDNFYTELFVNQEHRLTFFHSQNKKDSLLALKDNEWTIEVQKKCAYIIAGQKKLFEVITLESQDLVLLNILSGDKLFFAPLPQWYGRIQPEIKSTRHIAPDKEEKQID
jgi:hypothetical protein